MEICACLFTDLTVCPVAVLLPELPEIWRTHFFTLSGFSEIRLILLAPHFYRSGQNIYEQDVWPGGVRVMQHPDVIP